jgi:hypothetical protein
MRRRKVPSNSMVGTVICSRPAISFVALVIIASYRAGFVAVGRAYVEFAVEHPSYYQVMFGGFIESAAKGDDFVGEAKAAFRC